MTFAIAGATGRLRPLIRVLLEPGHHVRALTRTGESPIASELRSLGAEIWRGDFDEPETLAGAATGADASFAAFTRMVLEVDIATLHARYPEVGWQSFERWVEAQDRERLANPGRAA